MNRIRIWFDNLRTDSFVGVLLTAVVLFCLGAFLLACYMVKIP